MLWQARLAIKALIQICRLDYLVGETELNDVRPDAMDVLEFLDHHRMVNDCPIMLTTRPIKRFQSAGELARRVACSSGGRGTIAVRRWPKFFE